MDRTRPFIFRGRRMALGLRPFVPTDCRAAHIFSTLSAITCGFALVEGRRLKIESKVYNELSHLGLSAESKRGVTFASLGSSCLQPAPPHMCTGYPMLQHRIRVPGPYDAPPGFKHFSSCTAIPWPQSLGREPCSQTSTRACRSGDGSSRTYTRSGT